VVDDFSHNPPTVSPDPPAAGHERTLRLPKKRRPSNPLLETASANIGIPRMRRPLLAAKPAGNTPRVAVGGYQNARLLTGGKWSTAPSSWPARDTSTGWVISTRKPVPSWPKKMPATTACWHPDVTVIVCETSIVSSRLTQIRRNVRLRRQRKTSPLPSAAPPMPSPLVRFTGDVSTCGSVWLMHASMRRYRAAEHRRIRICTPLRPAQI
jgi:hypothetical protein